MQVPLQEVLVNSWQNSLPWLKEAHTLKDLLMLHALIADTLILLMLLSASFITTSQNAKTPNPLPSEHCLPVPLSPCFFVLYLSFLKRTPYEQRSVLHKSKQHLQIHSPHWGGRHQRAHMSRQCLTIQSGGAAVRQIDYDLLPVREVVLKRMQRHDMHSPALAVVSLDGL